MTTKNQRPSRPRSPAQLANDARLAALRANPESALAAEASSAVEEDEALGIGVEDDDAMADRITAMVDKAVEARLKAMGVPPTAEAPTGDMGAFAAFLAKFERLVEVKDEQRPGYAKPLTAAEMDGRKQGKADMEAILRRYKAEGIWPTYLLADEAGDGKGGFYGPGANGPMMYMAGQEIRTRHPPAECFQPLDEAAVAVYEAYKRWIGESVSIEDLTARAVTAAQADIKSAEMAAIVATAEPEVRVVDKPLRETGPKRVLGTVHPELRGRSLPGQPGVSQQPAGPIFVGDVT